MKITVVLLCWKRFIHFEEILKFWLSQPEVKQVIVLDNSGTFKTDLPILLLNSSRNLGSCSRIAAARFSKYDEIIFCDDDVILYDGIIKDLTKFYDRNKIIGVMGKIFSGDTYHSSPTIRGREISKPVELDYVPYNLCLVNRKHVLVDITKCPNGMYLDDLWWGYYVKQNNKDISSWAIPTQNYSFYPENKDKYALWKNKDSQALREIYFKKWFKK